MTIDPATLITRWRSVLSETGYAAHTRPIRRQMVEATIKALQDKDEQIVELKERLKQAGVVV